MNRFFLVCLIGLCTCAPSLLAQPVLSVVQTSLDIGTTAVGREIEQTIAGYVTNTGTDELDVSSVMVTGADAADFRINKKKFKLDPGESIDLRFRFRPASAGVKNAALQFTSNAQSAPVVVLTGTAVEPAIDISENPLAFGTVKVGRTEVKTLQIRNTGAVAGEIESIVLADPTGVFSLAGNIVAPLELAVGESLEIEVACTPVTTGSVHAQLELMLAWMDEEPVVVPVTATAVVDDEEHGENENESENENENENENESENENENENENEGENENENEGPEVLVSVQTVNFGVIDVAAMRDTVITVSNIGAVAITGTVALQNATEAFELPAAGTPVEIQPGGSVGIAVRFAAAQPGTYSDVLVIGFEGLATPLSIALEGTVQALPTSVAEDVRRQTVVAPNPFAQRTGVTIPLSAGVQNATVVDARGIPVRTLVPGLSTTIEWDGRNDNGAACADGVYYILVRTKAGILPLPVVLRR